MFIMGCPGGKINMAAVSAKRSTYFKNGRGQTRLAVNDCKRERAS